MNQEQVLREFFALPPVARQEVVNFIGFLRSKYAVKPVKEDVVSANISDEPFFGMWNNRTDMADSSQWVRHLRGSYPPSEMV